MKDMGISDAARLREVLQTRRDKIFNYPVHLTQYCIHDCLILMLDIAKFRDIISLINGEIETLLMTNTLAGIH